VNNCTDFLTPGSNLESWANANLNDGDVGCLHGGIYTGDGNITFGMDGVSFARITIQSFPGEQAEIVGSRIDTAGGTYLTLFNFTIRDVLLSDNSHGMSLDSDHNTVDSLTIRNTNESGILQRSGANDTRVFRTFLDHTGLAGVGHCIYVQGTGPTLMARNVCKDYDDYGFHVYGTSSGPANVTIYQNTAWISRKGKGGVLIRSEVHAGITVVNNVFDRAVFHTCNSPCLIDRNDAWLGWSNQQSGNPATNTFSENPALDTNGVPQNPVAVVDRARADFVEFPDKLGVTAPLGAGADLGAYEVG